MEEANKNRMKLVSTARMYALLAMAGGVFRRGLTKFNRFVGGTTLSVVHTHLSLLGMIFFLVAALFQFQADVTGQKRFHLFYPTYDIGMAMAVIMLIWHGITQVQDAELLRTLDASISDTAGIGHICTGIGTTLHLTMLKAAVRNRK